MGCFLALPIRILGQKWRQPLSGICCSLRKAQNSLIFPIHFIKNNSKFFWTDNPALKMLYWVKKHICLLTEKHQHEKIKLVDYLCCFLGSSSPSGVTDKCCVILGEGTKFPFLDFGIQEFLKKIICFKMRKNICEWCKNVPLKHRKVDGKKHFLNWGFLKIQIPNKWQKIPEEMMSMRKSVLLGSLCYQKSSIGGHNSGY